MKKKNFKLNVTRYDKIDSKLIVFENVHLYICTFKSFLQILPLIFYFCYAILPL